MCVCMRICVRACACACACACVREYVSVTFGSRLLVLNSLPALPGDYLPWGGLKGDYKNRLQIVSLDPGDSDTPPRQGGAPGRGRV